MYGGPPTDHLALRSFCELILGSVRLLAAPIASLTWPHVHLVLGPLHGGGKTLTAQGGL